MPELLHPFFKLREIGVLFQGAMVRALLAKTKTQTRRLLKDAPDADEYDRLRVGPYCPAVIDRFGFEHPGPEVFGAFSGDGEWAQRSPYGQPGDRLWVRETFFAFGKWEKRFSVDKGRDEWHFMDMTLECGHAYHYDVEDPVKIVGSKGRGGDTPMWWKRPAIFMPRAACRITLEITEVRVQRLQEVSEPDAVEEGYPGYGAPDRIGARTWYCCLWDSINGAGSWDANPWVWAVSFKRVTP